jgi:hypothetical protein
LASLPAEIMPALLMPPAKVGMEAPMALMALTILLWLQIRMPWPDS